MASCVCFYFARVGARARARALLFTHTACACVCVLVCVCSPAPLGILCMCLCVRVRTCAHMRMSLSISPPLPLCMCEISWYLDACVSKCVLIVPNRRTSRCNQHNHGQTRIFSHIHFDTRTSRSVWQSACEDSAHMRYDSCMCKLDALRQAGREGVQPARVAGV